MEVFRSTTNPVFRSAFSETIFYNKYAHEGADTWAELARTLVEDVCGKHLPKEEIDELVEIIAQMKFIPGGRYLYYAGRPIKAFNNCYLLRSLEDTREDWADLSWKAESCLTTGGGIGNDYSIYRRRGAPLQRTGGEASGPVSKAKMVNEIGREVKQGGSRRSAIYASLDAGHPDAPEWLTAKDWQHQKIPGTEVTVAEAKQIDFNYPAPLDMTNISLNYSDEWLLHFWNTGEVGDIFKRNAHQAMMTGEPGFSFNFFDKAKETLRNACTEVTSEDDSDVCNLGSVNLSRIDSVNDLIRVVYLSSKFLLCGTLVADVPYDRVREIRDKNRRIGLGLMGVHEWLVQRKYRYEVNDEFRKWLDVYKHMSEAGANELADTLGINRPVAYRAIAPTGTIGILAGTTTGIEPIFAVAYKRRYLRGNSWKYQYVIDSAALDLIHRYGVDPDSIESALDLADDYERRIRFQADVQDYVDMSISSTINLPQWGSKLNNEDKVEDFANVLATYSHRLRGFTCYPDGSRGGQPLTRVGYGEAKDRLGEEFTEGVQTHDVCDITGKGGSCGV